MLAIASYNATSFFPVHPVHGKELKEITKEFHKQVDKFYVPEIWQLINDFDKFVEIPKTQYNIWKELGHL